MKRDLSIDSLKGFLIILVIFGHIMGCLGISHGVWNLIYTFHMPLFVLISGYLFNVDKLNLKGILKPLLVFQIISLILLYIFNSEYSWLYLYTPYWTLWYLLSLIFWKIIMRLSYRILISRPIVCLLTAFLFSVIIGVVFPYGRIFSIQRTISFFPFFLMGYYFRKDLIKQKLWSNNFSIAIILLISFFIIFVWNPTNSKIILRAADPYTVYDLPSKCLILCFTLLTVLSFWNLRKRVGYLAAIGKRSLFYYLYHGLIIQFVLLPIIAKLGLPSTLLYSVIYLWVILALLHIMINVKLFDWLISLSVK